MLSGLVILEAPVQDKYAHHTVVSLCAGIPPDLLGVGTILEINEMIRRTSGNSPSPGGE
jgi:hypothetical protein